MSDTQQQQQPQQQAPPAAAESNAEGATQQQQQQAAPPSQQQQAPPTSSGEQNMQDDGAHAGMKRAAPTDWDEAKQKDALARLVTKFDEGALNDLSEEVMSNPAILQSVVRHLVKNGREAYSQVEESNKQTRQTMMANVDAMFDKLNSTLGGTPEASATLQKMRDMVVNSEKFDPSPENVVWSQSVRACASALATPPGAKDVKAMEPAQSKSMTNNNQDALLEAIKRAQSTAAMSRAMGGSMPDANMTPAAKSALGAPANGIEHSRSTAAASAATASQGAVPAGNSGGTSSSAAASVRTPQLSVNAPVSKKMRAAIERRANGHKDDFDPKARVFLPNADKHPLTSRIMASDPASFLNLAGHSGSAHMAGGAIPSDLEDIFSGAALRR
jgi:hypothetical protein